MNLEFDQEGFQLVGTLKHQGKGTKLFWRAFLCPRRMYFTVERLQPSVSKAPTLALCLAAPAAASYSRSVRKHKIIP